MKINRYKTIYADPPWPEYGGGQIKRGADAHYGLMSVEQIMRLNVDLVADSDCHLYLWVTNNYLPAGLATMKAWGFEYKTIITWAKDRFGLGQYFRGQTEHCLFGIRGRLPYKVLDEKRQQGVTLITAPRGEHSVKPAEMRQMIEVVSYEPRLELFARQTTPGWDVWGNEVQSDVNL